MFSLTKVFNTKFLLVSILAFCLILGTYFYNNPMNSFGANAASIENVSFDYNDYLKSLDSIKILKRKKNSDKIEKYKPLIEKELVNKLKTDKSVLNSTQLLNDIEQYFDYDESLWSEIGDIAKFTVKENRILNYPDGQKGSEVLPYNIEFNTKENRIITFEEFDIAGRPYDKNKVKISEKEKDEVAKSFMSKYNTNKTGTETPYSETVPKNLEDQKLFFGQKTEKLNSKKTTIASRAESNLLNSSLFESVNAYAATTYDKYGAANYARYWGGGTTNWNPIYPKFGQDCTNFVSQAALSGGLIKDYNNNDTFSKDWYLDYYNSKSQTWSVATRNADHMYDHENTGVWNRIYPSNAAYILDYGDLIYMNDSSGTHHVMMVTGAYWSSPDGRWHALYSQHTDDKSNADFDNGFYNSPNDIFWGLNIYGNVWDHI